MTRGVDIAIVGAGAAGLTAAIFAGRTRPAASVLALDGAPKVGAKILISGGGRCNVTNETVEAADFNGSSRNAIARVLRTFDVMGVREFFGSLGVQLKVEETGKLFPASGRARTVLDALLGACDDARVSIVTGARVHAIERRDDRFTISSAAGDVDAAAVILAAGGRSVPKTGSDGAAYEFAGTLGHSIVDPFPALVPLLLPRGHWMTGLSGISVDVELRVTTAGGSVLHRNRGSALMTHFGLSGPAILDVSRHWIARRATDAGAQLRVSFVPSVGFEAIEQRVLDGARSGHHESVGSLLRGYVTDRLAIALAERELDLAIDTPLTRLARAARRKLVHVLTDLALPISGDRGFDCAEVTAGGVPLAEIDTATMQSRRCPGLFLCGEILDVDGRIGGYNFQWAWASGRLAGIRAARS